MQLSVHVNLILLFLGICLGVHAYQKDTILEFKTAYFRPTHTVFKHIYNQGVLFGPEVTFALYRSIYGFARYDFFTKRGHSLGLHTPTTITLQMPAVGLKFMHCITRKASMYVGLGFQPVFVSTKNCSPDVMFKTHSWGLGGIVTCGAYIDLPHNFVIDFFADYSCANIKKTCCINSAFDYIQQTKAHVSGFIVGASLGYRFM